MFTRRHIDATPWGLPSPGVGYAGYADLPEMTVPRQSPPVYPPMRGYPGYWSQRMGCGHVGLRLDRGHPGEIAIGFGYAKDPSDPLTWRHQPTIFT